jgi:glycosyltransferase involved in cell wall biosynthesis
MSIHPPMSDYPLVSAIIPTRDRPALLACAMRSALRQTWPNLEVIVVVDGPDPLTEADLQTFADPRLRVIFLDERRGGSDARNSGVRAACGEWIAFLDDDDEWLPDKIAQQMRAAHAMPDWFPVVSCRLIAQSPTTSRVLPLRTYEQPQSIADFLFCRTSLRDPGGVLQCSTLLAPRELLLAVPFKSGLPMHQDWDWLIRVAAHKGALNADILVRPGDTVIVPKAGIVYVLGDVAHPGGYVMQNDSQLTVLQAIALAAGASKTASEKRVRLVRNVDGITNSLDLPLRDMERGREPDVPLQAGDILYVPFSMVRNLSMGLANITAAASSALIYATH